MDGTNPKVSFIPKGSLVREESFLERSRPRSVIGFIAIAVFILVVGAYAGLFYYNDLLNKEVAQKTTLIKQAQKEFSDAPEVGEAKVFRARADLARELLNAHTVTSPVFAFLSKNTLESILYDKFTFSNDPTGTTLELSGEAPTYAALAYQSDVLREQTKELASFSVDNVGLTTFGTVKFTLSLTFRPDFLLYTKNLSASVAATSQTTSEPAGTFSPALNLGEVTVPATLPSVATTSTTTEVVSTTPPLTEGGVEVATSTVPATGSVDGFTVSPREATTSASTGASVQPSFWSMLWSKLKFW